MVQGRRCVLVWAASKCCSYSDCFGSGFLAPRDGTMRRLHCVLRAVRSTLHQTNSQHTLAEAASAC
uniref:Uncharacterized protein n=1 Tax=Arundo donax TaxID=35708 RepID=A0A0A9FFM9_ARUDO